MTKSEKEIILKSYEDTLKLDKNGFDKKDVIRTLKPMLDNLELKEDRIKIENKINMENEKYNARTMFNDLFDSIKRIKGIYIEFEMIENGVLEDIVKYDIKDIVCESDYKSYNNAYKYIVENLK